MTTTHTRWEVPPEARELSVAELVKRLSSEGSRLMRLEIDLAKEELAEKARTAVPGIAMLVGAALFGLAALGALTALLILALDEVMSAPLAALIVLALWAIVAAVLALAGRARIRQATPVAPTQAAEGLKQDVRAAAQGIRAGRSGEITTTTGGAR